ncbi:MAG: hypothetical protein ACNYWM_10665 [Methanosarcinales archaeon]
MAVNYATTDGNAGNSSCHNDEQYDEHTSGTQAKKAWSTSDAITDIKRALYAACDYTWSVSCQQRL